MAQYLTLEDLRLARTPEALLALFRKLGYRVEPELVPLDPDELEFPPGAGIRRLFLLADHGRWQLFLFELEAVQMAHLRLLARDLLLRPGDYLIVAAPSGPPYDRVVFVNPRRIGSGTRLTVGIRKLVLEPAHPTRHDLDILEAIAAHGKQDDPAALYRAQVQAFDVERLTQHFYRDYAGLFRRACERIRDWHQAHPLLARPEESQSFTQRLLNRLMFLYFMQRKGWLAGDPAFLSSWYRQTVSNENRYWDNFLRPVFFETLNRRRVNDGSPWGDIPYLNGGLFEPREPDADPSLYLPDELFDPHDAEGLLSFLNSYNFTVAEDTPLEQEVALDPEMLGKVFENMLEEGERGQSGAFYTPRTIVHYMARTALRHYLAETTGLDEARLAVVFGGDSPDLATGEAANQRISESANQRIRGDTLASNGLSPAEAAKIDAALDTIRVLDPAVGSGALLVGMLHELVAVRRACWLARHPNQSEETPPVARWKREFIANSLYGVDLKPEAVEIARLRLWLSLVVDQGRAEVEPLPNLDYRLMVGNSLLETLDGEPILPGGVPTGGPTVQGALPGVPAPAQQLGLALGESGRTRTGLAELKAEYFTAETRAERQRLRQAIESQERALVLAALEERLAEIEARTKFLVSKGSQVNWQGMKKEEQALVDLANKQANLAGLAADVRQGKPLPFFLYRLHFFEVFRDKGGFDIVLANPPYVRQELIGDQKPALAREYPQVYQGTADLYVYFYARGLDLLRKNGVLTYISSNKFMRAGYGKKLRQFLGEQTTLETIIDFGDLPVFDATAYPSIVIARKTRPSTEQAIEALTVDDMELLERLEEEAPHRAWQISQAALHADSWTLERPETLALMAKLRASGTALGEYVQGQFFNGVKTGLNEAFVIDESTREHLLAEDSKSADLIRPWLQGRDIDRWAVNWPGQYVIYVTWDCAIENYTAIKNYLAKFREALEHRDGVRNNGPCPWYAMSRPRLENKTAFEQPKIIYPHFNTTVNFAFDEASCLSNDKTYIIPTDNLYLLGILNSKVSEFMLRQLSPTVQRGYMEFRTIYVGQLPVPDVSSTERQAIEKIIRRLLALRGEGAEVAALEAELNERVYRLFGLTREEVRLGEGEEHDTD